MLTPRPRIDRNAIVEELYQTYCSAVGGVAFNGDPLPDWKTFSGDPTKNKQSKAWLVVADKALELLHFSKK